MSNIVCLFVAAAAILAMVVSAATAAFAFAMVVVVTAAAAMITGMTGDIWWLAGGMLLIAVLANITAFWRIAHCYKVMTQSEKAQNVEATK